MPAITLVNYVPTLIKAKFHPLEVTYGIQKSWGTGEELTVFKVVCNEANITELLSKEAMADIVKEVVKALKQEGSKRYA